jgi:hypothetical protein
MWIATQKVPATDFQDAKPADEPNNTLRKVMYTIIFFVLSALGCRAFGVLFLRYMIATFMTFILTVIMTAVCFIRPGYASMFMVYHRAASFLLESAQFTAPLTDVRSLSISLLCELNVDNKIRFAFRTEVPSIADVAQRVVHC